MHFQNCIQFLIHFISYLCTVAVLLMACFYFVSHFMCECGCFFSIQTILVWFLAASIKVYCSALDTFYNRKSLYDATHFVFWPLSTTIRFNIFSHLKANDVTSAHMTTVNERRWRWWQGIGQRHRMSRLHIAMILFTDD